MSLGTKGLIGLAAGLICGAAIDTAGCFHRVEGKATFSITPQHTITTRQVGARRTGASITAAPLADGGVRRVHRLRIPSCVVISRTRSHHQPLLDQERRLFEEKIGYHLVKSSLLST